MKRISTIIGILLIQFATDNCYAQELTLRNENNKFGFVASNTDKWVLKPKYTGAHPFKGDGFDNQFTVVSLQDGKYGRTAIIDKAGKEPFEKYTMEWEVAENRYASGYFPSNMHSLFFDLRTGKTSTLSFNVKSRYLPQWNQKFIAFPNGSTGKVNLFRLRDMTELYKAEYDNIDFTNPNAVIFIKDGFCAVTDTSFTKPLEFNKVDTCLACTNFKGGMADVTDHSSIARAMFEMIKDLLPDHFEKAKGELISKEEYKTKFVSGYAYRYGVKHVGIGATTQEIIQVFDDDGYVQTMKSSFYHATFENTVTAQAFLNSSLAATMIKAVNNNDNDLTTQVVDCANGKLIKIIYKELLLAVYLVEPGKGTFVIGNAATSGWGLISQATLLASLGIVIPPEEKEYVYTTPIIENNFIGEYHQTEEQIKKHFSHEYFTEQKFDSYKQIRFKNSQGQFAFIINKMGVCMQLYYLAATQELYNTEASYLIKTYQIGNTNDVWTYRSMTDGKEINIERIMNFKKEDGTAVTDIPIYIFGNRYEEGWVKQQ
jgi:hypothetical protein